MSLILALLKIFKKYPALSWLVPPLADGDLEDLDWLIPAQALHLRQSVGVANFGTTLSIVLLSIFFFRFEGSSLSQILIANKPLLIWMFLGFLTFLFRLFITFQFTEAAIQGSDLIARRYLLASFWSTVLSGIAYGYGWIAIVPDLNFNGQLIYILTVATMLFGSLYAYGPYLPSYLVFTILGVLPAPVVFLLQSNSSYAIGQAYGVSLLAVVSALFALRWFLSFVTNARLQKDISALLREISVKRDEAVEANKNKSKFLAMVSHDLRQPMHSISLYLSALKRQWLSIKAEHQITVESTGKFELQIKSLHESAQYLVSMFESLLDISRLDAGVMEIKLQYINIDKLLENLAIEFAEIAKANGLFFEIIVPADIERLLVFTDKLAFERLLRNLITNAIRYTVKGGVRLTIRRYRGRLDFRVIDTGVGVPKGMKSKIFDEFVQLKHYSNLQMPERHIGMGLGLGLAIATRLAGKLGTTIRVSSRIGIGSVFAFSVKYGTGSVLEKPAKKINLTPSKSGSDEWHDKLIAVIDDDMAICLATQALLEALGAHVITAQSSGEAIQKLTVLSDVPALVLCDFKLINENGFEAIERIRDEFNNWDIPAIVITGDTAPSDFLKFNHLGFEVLFKPLEEGKLLAAIRLALAEK